MKHSPAPWIVGPSNHGNDHFIIKSRGECILSTSAGIKPKETNSANVQLAAAAPALAQVCLNVFATIEIDLFRIQDRYERTALDCIKREIRTALVNAGYPDPQIDITLRDD